MVTTVTYVSHFECIITNFSKKSSFFSLLRFPANFLTRFHEKIYVNFPSKYTQYMRCTPNILCHLLQSVYITTIICVLCNNFMNLHYGNPFWGFLPLGIDFFSRICYHFYRKSCDEDMRLRKDSQREGRLVRGL